jgi:hypothetical protein
MLVPRAQRDLIDDDAVDTHDLLEAQINRNYVEPIPDRAPKPKAGINGLLAEINEEEADHEALREVHGDEDADDE